MPIFNTSTPSFQGPTAVTGTAAAIYSTTGSSNPTVNFATGTALSAITVINTGAVTCYVGNSSLTTAVGIPLKAGEQLTISNGNGHIAAESGVTSWNLYAITASGSTTVEVSLVTTAIVE